MCLCQSFTELPAAKLSTDRTCHRRPEHEHLGELGGQHNGLVKPPALAMTIRPETQTLIAALVQAHQSGQPLRAADWVSAVHDEVDAYAVQDGVATALGWPQGALVRHWKSGGATRSGPFRHAPLDPAGISPAG